MWLLGMHPKIASRNFSVDNCNRWTITDNYCRMAGRGLEDSLENWQFPLNMNWFIARDHANLLYPMDKWQDSLGRSLNQGIEDFNNLYSNYWKQSKTIWLDIETIDDLRFVDKLGAIKNYQQSHIHYSNTEYQDRFKDVRHRILVKQSRFTGDFISVNVKKLWIEDSKAEFKRIAEFLTLDDSFVEIWTHMTEYWSHKNEQLICNYKNCVPISL